MSAWSAWRWFYGVKAKFKGTLVLQRRGISLHKLTFTVIKRTYSARSVGIAVNEACENFAFTVKSNASKAGLLRLHEWSCDGKKFVLLDFIHLYLHPESSIPLSVNLSTRLDEPSLSLLPALAHTHVHVHAHTQFHLKSLPKLSCNSGVLWNCQVDGRAEGDCG